MLPVAVAWRCDKLCTSGFVDDAVVLYRGVSGPESSTALCLEEVRQVATPGAKSVIYD